MTWTSARAVLCAAAARPTEPTFHQGADSMSIERKHTNARMGQIVIHGDTVYLAGLLTGRNRLPSYFHR